MGEKKTKIMLKPAKLWIRHRYSLKLTLIRRVITFKLEFIFLAYLMMNKNQLKLLYKESTEYQEKMPKIFDENTVISTFNEYFDIFIKIRKFDSALLFFLIIGLLLLKFCIFILLIFNTKKYEKKKYFKIIEKFLFIFFSYLIPLAYLFLCFEVDLLGCWNKEYFEDNIGEKKPKKFNYFSNSIECQSSMNYTIRSLSIASIILTIILRYYLWRFEILMNQIPDPDYPCFIGLSKFIKEILIIIIAISKLSAPLIFDYLPILGHMIRYSSLVFIILMYLLFIYKKPFYNMIESKINLLIFSFNISIGIAIELSIFLNTSKYFNTDLSFFGFSLVLTNLIYKVGANKLESKSNFYQIFALRSKNLQIPLNKKLQIYHFLREMIKEELEVSFGKKQFKGYAKELDIQTKFTKENLLLKELKNYAEKIKEGAIDNENDIDKLLEIGDIVLTEWMKSSRSKDTLRMKLIFVDYCVKYSGKLVEAAKVLAEMQALNEIQSSLDKTWEFILQEDYSNIMIDITYEGCLVLNAYKDLKDNREKASFPLKIPVYIDFARKTEELKEKVIQGGKFRLNFLEDLLNKGSLKKAYDQSFELIKTKEGYEKLSKELNKISDEKYAPLNLIQYFYEKLVSQNPNEAKNALKQFLKKKTKMKNLKKVFREIGQFHDEETVLIESDANLGKHEGVTVKYVTSNIKEVVGWDVEEIVGKSLESMMPNPTGEFHRIFWSKTHPVIEMKDFVAAWIKSSEGFISPIGSAVRLYLTKDGTPRWFSILDKISVKDTRLKKDQSVIICDHHGKVLEQNKLAIHLIYKDENIEKLNPGLIQINKKFNIMATYMQKNKGNTDNLINDSIVNDELAQSFKTITEFGLGKRMNLIMPDNTSKMYKVTIENRFMDGVNHYYRLFLIDPILFTEKDNFFKRYEEINTVNRYFFKRIESMSESFINEADQIENELSLGQENLIGDYSDDNIKDFRKLLVNNYNFESHLKNKNFNINQVINEGSERSNNSVEHISADYNDNEPQFELFDSINENNKRNNVKSINGSLRSEWSIYTREVNNEYLEHIIHNEIDLQKNYSVTIVIILIIIVITSLHIFFGFFSFFELKSSANDLQFSLQIYKRISNLNQIQTSTVNSLNCMRMVTNKWVEEDFLKNWDIPNAFEFCKKKMISNIDKIIIEDMNLNYLLINLKRISKEDLEFWVKKNIEFQNYIENQNNKSFRWEIETYSRKSITNKLSNRLENYSNKIYKESIGFNFNEASDEEFIRRNMIGKYHQFISEFKDRFKKLVNKLVKSNLNIMMISLIITHSLTIFLIICFYIWLRVICNRMKEFYSELFDLDSRNCFQEKIALNLEIQACQRSLFVEDIDLLELNQGIHENSEIEIKDKNDENNDVLKNSIENLESITRSKSNFFQYLNSKLFYLVLFIYYKITFILSLICKYLYLFMKSLS